MYSEPPPLETHFYGIGSASTLTIGLGHQPVAPPFPKPGERQPPSVQNTSTTASRITPQVSSQRSGHSSGWRSSRRDTATSEPLTPLCPDPSSFYPNGSWGSQPTQVYRQMSGAAKSRASLKGTPDDRHRSRKDVNATGEGYNRGGSSLNPSRMSPVFTLLLALITSQTEADLLANTPQDHPGRHGRSSVPVSLSSRPSHSTFLWKHAATPQGL